MSFKDNYKTMNHYISPDKEMTNNTLSQMNETTSITKKRPYKIIMGIAAACAVVLAAFAAFGVFSGNKPDDQIAQLPPSYTDNPTGTPIPTSTPTRIELTGTAVNFSDLGLDLPNVQYPEMPESTACLAAFREDMIMDSCLIIQGTVQNIRLNDYLDTQTTAVYEICVDDILYSEKDVAPGDVILIEQDLYMATSIQDSVVGLKPGGQYILPITELPEEYAYVSEFTYESDLIAPEAKNTSVNIERAHVLESRYQIIYPFMPPIQVVPGVGWLFPSNWESLITDDASPVVMDETAAQATDGTLYYETLYLRDETILLDIQTLIDEYTSNEYRTEHAAVTSGEMTIDGRVKTTKSLAYIYTQDQLSPFIMVDIDSLSDDDMQRILAQTQEYPHTILISDFECEQTASGQWAAKYTEYLENDVQKAKQIIIPEYIDVPTDTQAIAIADKFLTDQSLTPSVRYEKSSQCFFVDYTDTAGRLKIRAQITVIGHLYMYLIFE